MTDAPYTTKDIIEKLNIPMQRLRMWLLNGYIQPSLPSEGQGKKAYFSLYDIYAIALFAKLLQKGFKRKLAAKYIRTYQEAINSPNFLHYAQYLIFITSLCTEQKEDGHYLIPGKTQITMHPISGFEEMGLLLRTNRLDLYDPKHRVEFPLGEFVWEDITIIHYALVKGLVNSALNVRYEGREEC